MILNSKNNYKLSAEEQIIENLRWKIKLHEKLLTDARKELRNYMEMIDVVEECGFCKHFGIGTDGFICQKDGKATDRNDYCESFEVVA